MNGRHHSLPLMALGVAGVVLLLVIGADTAALGIGLAFLVCPIVMGIVMWLLMRQPAPRTAARQPRPPVPTTRREL